MIILSLICFISLLLFVLFETNAIVDYFKLLRINKFLPKYSEYKDIIDAGGSVLYLTFLNKADQRFLIKIITCPTCFSIYFSLFISILTVELVLFPIICYFSLIGYLVLKSVKK